MPMREEGWTGLLRREGPDFLTWIRKKHILLSKFEILTEALWTLLCREVRTSEGALQVWNAVTAVLQRCDEQCTYDLPGAAAAYAWLHLPERYVRTWLALEHLVEECCLPMGKHGVNALDVGTGPGPAAFALHDFYAAMTEYSGLRGNLQWHQPARVTCVEMSGRTNHLRHCLAELMFEQTQRQAPGLLAMCNARPDFQKIIPSQERQQDWLALREAEDEYFDEEAGGWASEPLYTPEEASAMAQSAYRHRLIVFSNFLTTPEMVQPASPTTVQCKDSQTIRPNLEDILQDAAPGSVLMVLGGKGKSYSPIYSEVDRVARNAAFQRKVAERTVSHADSEVAEQVYAVGKRFFHYLEPHIGHVPDDTPEQKRVREEFGGGPVTVSCSALRVWRKHRYAKKP